MERLEFDTNKISVVDINSVKPNAWNPKEKGTKEYQKILKSVKANGQMLPIRVREVEGDTPYEIIDGEQKWTACAELGYEKVIIYNEGVMPDEKAQALTIWFEQQVPFDEVKEAKLAAKLANDFPDLELPYFDDELDEMRKMADSEFDETKSKEDDGKDTTNHNRLSVALTENQYQTIIEGIEAAKENGAEGTAEALTVMAEEYLAKE